MLQLENLQSRIPFGPANDPAQCQPWNPPVSRFDLPWLKSSFVPAQLDRLGRVTKLIEDANKAIEGLRSQATNRSSLGERKPNGVVLRSGSDLNAETVFRTHAQQQLTRDIIALREPLDKTIAPILRDMARASFTADTLRQRVFNKESCLSRASLTGLDRAGFAALKANYSQMLHHLAPIELFNMAQRVLDDASAESLPLLDSIRLENFRRPKGERAFLNARLLELANVPEFTESQPLLDQVQDANKQALLLWSQFSNHSSRVSIMKMSTGLQKLGVKDPTDPYADLGGE